MLSCRVLRGLLPNTAAPADLPSLCLGHSTTSVVLVKKQGNIHKVHPEGSKRGSPTTDHKSEVNQLTCVQSVGGRKLLQGEGRRKWKWKWKSKGSKGRWSELGGRVLGRVSTSTVLKSHQAGKVTSSPWHGGDTEKSHQVVESHIREEESPWHSLFHLS